MDVSLIVNWLGRQGGDVLRWWLLVTLAGAAVWPLLYRVMGGLPDRGYTLARAAGVMLIGFIFWFLGSLGLLQNRPSGAVFAWVVVLAIGIVAFFHWEDRPPLRPWLREHWALIVLTEVLFLVLLFGWAAYRAHNPEVDSTEKPMELMFLNSIRASAAFPPHDAWLSGYAISYYYFGYVIMATLADLAGIGSGIAFGIMIALLFALSGIGALGIVYNLVRAQGRRAGVAAALGAGVLGMCFLILMGNLGTALIELPYRGYTPGLVNAAYFDFWDVAEREGEVQIQTGDQGTVANAVVDSNGNGVPDWEDKAQSPDKWSYWWWFRYSRVVQDRQLNGTPEPVQPIEEFPNFSFVLSDLHPHVLALPFALLAIGLALNLVLGARDLRRWEYPLYAIWVGGMVFMNSWDAIYLPLLVGAETLRRLIRNGNGVLHRTDLTGIVRFALAIGGLTLVFYLPWIVSFTSQASGILPNVIYPTPWQQFFLHFGIFLIILAVFLMVELRRAGWRFYWQAGLLAVTTIIVGERAAWAAP
jgi:YYY domain-containing protein